MWCIFWSFSVRTSRGSCVFSVKISTDNTDLQETLLRSREENALCCAPLRSDEQQHVRLLERDEGKFLPSHNVHVIIILWRKPADVCLPDLLLVKSLLRLAAPSHSFVCLLCSWAASLKRASCSWVPWGAPVRTLAVWWTIRSAASRSSSTVTRCPTGSRRRGPSLR